MVDLRYVIDYLAYNGIFYLVNEPMQRHTTFQIGAAGGTYAVEAMKKSYAPLLFAV